MMEMVEKNGEGCLLRLRGSSPRDYANAGTPRLLPKASSLLWHKLLSSSELGNVRVTPHSTSLNILDDHVAFVNITIRFQFYLDSMEVKESIISMTYV